MSNPWFKFYGGEYLSDPKIKSLDGNQRSCWLTLLSLGATATIPGKIEFMNVKTLLRESGIREGKKYIEILNNFQSMRMIRINDEDGSIDILNWEKRQEHNLSVAERVAKSRINKKNVTNNVTDVTSEESRVDKSRVEEREVPPHKYKKYLREIPETDLNGFAKEYRISTDGVRMKGKELDNYCNARGKVYKNYKAFLDNALFKDCDAIRIKYPPPKPVFIPPPELTVEEREKSNQILTGIREGLYKKLTK